MPSTVADLAAAAEVRIGGVVRWLDPVSSDRPGVYVVSLAADGRSLDAALATAPISSTAIEELLGIRPELLVDGHRPSAHDLAERLSRFWLPDEVVTYIGLAGSSLRSRVAAFYRTPLGARRPHAGGWFLKTLEPLPEMRVHWAEAEHPGAAEYAMIEEFVRSTSATSRNAILDAAHPFPFANLEWPPGTRKRHGITGAKEPAGGDAHGASRPGRGETDARRPSVARALPASSAESQEITEADRQVGQVRVPKRSKHLFPSQPELLPIIICGRELEARWDPRLGPDRERSGIIRVGKQSMVDLVPTGAVLVIGLGRDGVVELTLS